MRREALAVKRHEIELGNGITIAIRSKVFARCAAWLDPRALAVLGRFARLSSDDLRAVLTKPEIKDKLAARGAYVHPATPTEAQAFVRSQQELWKPALEHVAMQFKKK